LAVSCDVQMFLMQGWCWESDGRRYW